MRRSVKDIGSLQLEQMIIIVSAVSVIPFILVPLLVIISTGTAWLGGQLAFLLTGSEATAGWYAVWLPASVLLSYAVSSAASWAKSRGDKVSAEIEASKKGGGAEAHDSKVGKAALLAVLGGMAIGPFTAGLVSALLSGPFPAAAADAGSWTAFVRVFLPVIAFYVMVLVSYVPMKIAKEKREAAAKKPADEGVGSTGAEG